jgi:hypothetical protein
VTPQNVQHLIDASQFVALAIVAGAVTIFGRKNGK